MTVPSQMRAAFIRSLGGPEVIEVGALPVPEPGPTDVLVRTLVTAVDSVDTFVRSGAYSTPTPFPFVIGRDLVGDVVVAGAGSGFTVGERVWTNSLGHGGRQGAAAEYAVIGADRVFRLPSGVDPTEAVAAVHGWSTAYLGVVREGQVRTGQTVYIGGGAGAVGSGAVALAARAGARVVASAAASDRDRVQRAGAGIVVDHHRDDVLDHVGESAPDGYDLWWDTSGRQSVARGIGQLAPRGTLVVSAGLHGDIPLPLGALYTRDARILGFAISNARVSELADAAAAVNALFEAGVPRPRVAEVLPLENAADAHRRLEAGGVRGRIVLAL